MMNSLLKSIGTARNEETLLKESLRSNLMTSVKEVQLEYSQATQDHNEQGKSDASNSFCIVLEAVFIHGLKETLADRMALALSDPDQRPEPNFWSPLLVFSHRQIIDQIGELSLVTTDVGRCRAWLRLALNDCLLSSYLQSMALQNNALKPYYKPSAYLRDIDLLDVTKQIIEGVEACEFEFACNSSLLNVWTNPPLLMAGLWTPPMKSFPVSSGTDIARTLNFSEDNMKIDDIVSVGSFASYQESLPSSSQSILFDEEGALKIILGTKVNEPGLLEPRIINQDEQTKKNEETSGHDGEENEKEEENTEIMGIGNSLGHTGWSSTLGDDNKENEKGNTIAILSTGNSLDHSGWSSSLDVLETLPCNKDNNVIITDDIINLPKEHKPVSKVPKLQSYHSLVESYNQGSTTGGKIPDLNDFIQRFQSSTSSNIILPPMEIDNEQVSEFGFEIISSPPTSGFNVAEFGHIIQQLGYLPLELGLDSQNYTCKSCSQNIGINFTKSITRVCSLTGSYYCEECFDMPGPSEEWVIPARIVHNWDFRRHPVCCQAADFLTQIQHHPLININLINPRLYLAVEEMSQLQDLRIRLNLLRAYLQLCREPVIEELQKRVWPREYLYEHVHLYSIADLVEIPSGALAQQLKNAVSFAHKHVTSCWLCSQKGFICEICNNTKVIYPFEMEDTYRCGVCKSVFHTSCLNVHKPCPKCKRRNKRDHYQQTEEVS